MRHAPEPAGVALAVAVATDVGELGATGCLERAATLDRGRVEQHQIIARARALRGEHTDQPLDRVAQPLTALMQRVLGRQERKEMPELPAGGSQEPPVARDPHQHLSDTERHDLRVRKPPSAITRLGSRSSAVQ